jgi:hypothetical protein
MSEEREKLDRVEQHPEAAEVLAVGPEVVAKQLLDGLSEGVAADANEAGAALRRLRSAEVKRLRKEAETVADRFEALTEEAELAERQAKAERADLRSLRKQISSDLDELLRRAAD